MLRKTSGPRFDSSTVTDFGARPYQQDALVANFSAGEDIGIGVLADGMGGHFGGDVASALVVGQAFAEIRAGVAAIAPSQEQIARVLRASANVANDAVRRRIEAEPDLRGMGATLLACLTLGPDLHWVSVGDSPLYLYRDKTLCQLNDDHSMKPRIRAMVASGMIDAELAATHPDRNQLLSAICGRPFEHIDCRAAPYPLKTGDVVIAASDGIQTLPDGEICKTVNRYRRSNSDEIAKALMAAVKKVGAPDQDNTAIMVIKVLSTEPMARAEPRPDAAMPADLPSEAQPDGALAAEDGASLERAPDDLEKAFAL
ncbi:MAG: protein phosphatase 2C domain-containing protein [Pseudomonadota bacterium]